MKIEKIKKTGSKYKITLDNGSIITTYEEVILKHGILYHKYINSKLIDKIKNDTSYYKTYNKVLDMINRRLRSKYEIEEYLNKNEIDEKDKEEIIINLERIGLLNDEAYAKAYTNDKVNLSLDGPYKIKKHLENQKIDEAYINEAISNIDENIINSHIDKIIKKRIENNKKYTPYILKQKIMIYLTGLGYSQRQITNRLENFTIENVNSEKEMDKIYNKLSKKISGKELYFKLKNKLYTKGYSKEEIDEYINKKDSSLLF